MDKHWLSRAEALSHHQVPSSTVEHGLAIADEAHQDKIRAASDWRLPA